MADADFTKLKAATTPFFDGAIAQDDANKKDFTGAIAAFTNELKAYPDPSQTQAGPGLNDTYLLGQAYAQQTPPDLLNAAWFLTRAAQFAPAQAKPQIETAAEYFYKKYHGSLDGYPAVQALAQANLFPPPAYNPTKAPPPPSPADLAAQTVASTPDLKSLSLSDKEFILFNGKKVDCSQPPADPAKPCVPADPAGKVWDTMKGTRVEVPGMVISASADSVQLAVTEDNKQSKKADFTINMKTPLKTVPAIGATVTFDATFDSYVADPPMITLIDGEPPAKAKPTPVHHKPAHTKLSPPLSPPTTGSPHNGVAGRCIYSSNTTATNHMLEWGSRCRESPPCSGLCCLPASPCLPLKRSSPRRPRRTCFPATRQPRRPMFFPGSWRLLSAALLWQLHRP